MDKEINKEKIKAIDAKIAKLKAQAQRINAVASKEDRAKDTRRKILVGAWLLNKVGKGEYEKEKLIANMDQFLDKPRDRILFGLDIKEEVSA